MRPLNEELGEEEFDLEEALDNWEPNEERDSQGDSNDD